MIFKRVTDDEALRLFLYLQKISREWSLLNNITWDRIGSAVADTTYGGYVIITGALFIGRLVGELPTHKRITEFVLLGIGTILFIVLGKWHRFWANLFFILEHITKRIFSIGSLELAALDSVPPDLVDNAAILGGVSLLTAVLFLIDMGGPKAKRTSTHAQTVPRSVSKPLETRTISQQVYEIEREIDRSEKTHLDSPKVEQKEVKNGHAGQNGVKKESKNGERTKRFGIYGKDVLELEEQKGDSEWEDIPPKMAAHSPVWSHIRKGTNVGY